MTTQNEALKSAVRKAVLSALSGYLVPPLRIIKAINAAIDAAAVQEERPVEMIKADPAALTEWADICSRAVVAQRDGKKGMFIYEDDLAKIDAIVEKSPASPAAPMPQGEQCAPSEDTSKLQGWAGAWKLTLAELASAHRTIKMLLDANEALEAKYSAQPVAAQPAPIVIPEELRKIGELLRTQDNRITDQPIFTVQQKRLVYGFDPDYADGDEHVAWLIEDQAIHKGDEGFAELEARYQEELVIPDDYTRTCYQVEWEFVTACFTEQGCKDYITSNGHNLKEPRIYADGSYRNHEYRLVRDWLMSLDASTAQLESKDAERYLHQQSEEYMDYLSLCPEHGVKPMSFDDYKAKSDAISDAAIAASKSNGSGE